MMNLPTEYVLRNERIRSMLKLPCSLFLGNVKVRDNEPLKGKVVLTIHPSNENHLRVCRYDLDKISTGKVPAVFSECYILTSELFTSEFVILHDHKPLLFVESPYNFYGKQETTMPHAVLQEKEYVGVVDNYFVSKFNRLNRERWLWNAFEKLNVSNELRAKYFGDNMTTEQDIVKQLSSNIWRMWEVWKKMFLSYEGVASELVFGKVYGMPVPFTPITEDVDSTSLTWNPNEFVMPPDINSIIFRTTSRRRR